jgi:pimeloyl-ACP methyl ester carboxylesterase
MVRMRSSRHRRFSRTALTLTSLAAAVLLAACSTTVVGKPEAQGQPPQGLSPSTQGQQAPPQQAHREVEWHHCTGLGGDDGDQLPAGAQCGELTVPIDYSKPDAGTAKLKLIRFPATGDKIGSLLINPGGPGGSGIEAAAGFVEALPPQVRQRFDFVGFDPRGVGLSTPALRCDSDADNDAARADPEVDYSPGGIAHIEDVEKQFVQRCVDKMGKDFLANVGTATVVKDLDALREALGDEKLTYLGYSYGTAIGTAYAEAYPGKVRAMILDGAVDPNQDSIQSEIDQTTGFQKAFNDFAADCAKAPECALGTDPAKAVEVFRGLVDPLVAKPVPTADGRPLGYGDAVTGTQMALYSPTLWRQLREGLSELKKGQGGALLDLADTYNQRDSQGHYTNANDALIAINCVDHPPNTDRAKAADEDRQIREVAPFLTYGQFTGAAPLDTCAFWPVPPTSTPHTVSVQGLPPTLVVSTTNDPATPYQAGVDLAHQLGSGLLTYNGTQHTVVFQGDACVDDAAAAYLIDVKLPPPNTTC